MLRIAGTVNDSIDPILNSALPSILSLAGKHFCFNLFSGCRILFSDIICVSRKRGVTGAL